MVINTTLSAEVLPPLTFTLDIVLIICFDPSSDYTDDVEEEEGEKGD
jgi:hypothetical protein